MRGCVARLRDSNAADFLDAAQCCGAIRALQIEFFGAEEGPQAEPPSWVRFRPLLVCQSSNREPSSTAVRRRRYFVSMVHHWSLFRNEMASPMAGAVNPKAAGSKPVCGAKHCHYEHLSLSVNWLFAVTARIGAIPRTFPILQRPRGLPLSRPRG